MTAADAIKARLIEKVGVVDGTSIFGNEVDIPMATFGILSILETGGYPPIGTHNEGFGIIRQPAFQITARAPGSRATITLIQSAWDAMCAKNGSNQPIPLSNITIGGVFFLMIRPEQDPFMLSPDANKRFRQSFNVSTVVRG
jgi:hypothetical protein